MKTPITKKIASVINLQSTNRSVLCSSDFGDVGAADKAAIQLVKVQPYQLLVSDT